MGQSSLKDQFFFPGLKHPQLYFFAFFSSLVSFVSFFFSIFFFFIEDHLVGVCVCVHVEDVPEQSCSHPHILQKSLKMVLVFRPHKYICYVQYAGAKLVHLLTPVYVSTVTEEPNGFHLFTSLCVFQKSNHSP